MNVDRRVGVLDFSNTWNLRLRRDKAQNDFAPSAAR